MSALVLISPLAEKIPRISGADYAGVDAGALRCMEAGIEMVFALGDFDTAGGALTQIEQQVECHILPCRKDETDMESALKEAYRRGYTTIILYGVLQGRFDHTMANLYLLLHRDPSLILMDAHNRVRVLLPGSYTVAKQYAYLSFLALEESSISEGGVAYPLDHAHIDVTDIFTVSNEIIEEEAQITVHEGRVLMIEADDRP